VNVRAAVDATAKKGPGNVQKTFRTTNEHSPGIISFPRYTDLGCEKDAGFSLALVGMITGCIAESKNLPWDGDGILT